MRLSTHVLTLILVGSAAVVHANTPDSRIPGTWLETPMTRIPHHVPVRGWTEALNMAEEDFLILRVERIYLEVPPGETLRAEFRSTWDSEAVIAMESDAWWKFGLGFSKRSQRFKNREQTPKFAWVGLSFRTFHSTPGGGCWVDGGFGGNGGYSGVSNSTGTAGVGGPFSFIGGTGTIQHRPWRITFSRSWDIAAWRAVRMRSAPDPATLPERAPAALKPDFVPGRPLGGEFVGEAEVTLILDSGGRPWAVHPGEGHPELVSRLSEWAWRLNFEAPKDLGSGKAVKVPLRVTFLSKPVAEVR